MNTLKRNNISRRSTQTYTTKYISDEKFFERIDTEEKAYFLGLLYADGNNYVRELHNYEVSIKLQAQDKIILEKFKNLISPQSSLKLIIDKKTNNLYYLFKINNKKISEQLSCLGCIPNKSLLLKFPNFIEEKLINHFIRGYFDGDGSLYCKKPKYKTNYINYGLSIVSSKMFCEEIKHIIENKINIHFSSKLSRPKTNQITTTLSVGGNKQVKKVLDWLYQDATIYLPRKYTKYQEFINFV